MEIHLSMTNAMNKNAAFKNKKNLTSHLKDSDQI